MRLVLTLLLGLGCGGDDPKSSEDSGASDGADGDDPQVDPLDWELREAGPYHVGHQQLIVTYTTALGDSRTIPVDIWYPTTETTGDTVFYIDAFIDPEALGEAAAAPPVHQFGGGAAYPVLLYSHGYQGFGGSSSFLMRHFASHGWVAIAPDHVGNLLSDNVEPLPTAHYIYRPQDMTAALNAVEAQAESLLAGPIHADSVLMSGHSYGVYTTWMSAGATVDPELLDEACNGGDFFKTGSCTPQEAAVFLSGVLNEPRVIGSIPLAGSIRRGLHGQDGHRSAHGPFFSMSGGNDSVGAEEQFDSCDGLDFSWIEIEGACHQSFALGTCEWLDQDVGFAIVDTYALAFARNLLLADEAGDTVGILDGSVEVSDLVSYQHREP